MESSLEQFIKAAAAFPVALLIADITRRIVRVNQKAEMMFGYQRDELIDQTIETLKPERYRDRLGAIDRTNNLAPYTRLMGLGGIGSDGGKMETSFRVRRA